MFKKFGLLIVVVILLAVVSPAHAAPGCTVTVAEKEYFPGTVNISDESNLIEVKNCESINLTQGKGWTQSAHNYRTAGDGVIYLYFTSPLEEKAYLTDDAGHVWEIIWESEAELLTEPVLVQSDTIDWLPWFFVVVFAAMIILGYLVQRIRDRQKTQPEPSDRYLLEQIMSKQGAHSSGIDRLIKKADAILEYTRKQDTRMEELPKLLVARLKSLSEEQEERNDVVIDGLDRLTSAVEKLWVQVGTMPQLAKVVPEPKIIIRRFDGTKFTSEMTFDSLEGNSLTEQLVNAAKTWGIDASRQRTNVVFVRVDGKRVQPCYTDPIVAPTVIDVYFRP